MNIHIRMKSFQSKVHQLGAIILVFLSMSSAAFAQGSSKDFFKAADAFFKKHVNNGLVTYELIHQDRSELDALNKQLDEMDLKALDANTKKAVLINAYNIWVITNVIDNYPIKSPMDVPGFFDRIKHSVGGNSWTLDHLENKELRPTYKDARFHFVLVCGAKGCPPIVNFAYVPEKLDDQMDQQTKNALNNPEFIKTDSRTNQAYLSEIFKWYEGDFKMDHPNVLSYINSYRENKIPDDYKVSYYPYDWQLNIQGGIAKGGGPASNPMTDPGDEPEAFNPQTYNPGTLLRKGQFDLTLFNSIYTQDRSRWMGQEFSGSRESFYGTAAQFTYGVSENARLNLGIEVNFRASSRSSDSTYGSLFNPFMFTNTDSTRVGVSSVGARVKLNPFEGNNDFSFQSTFYVPTAPSLEGNDSLYFLDWDRFIWWNQFFFTKTFGDFQLFTEADLWFRFRRRAQQRDALDIPLSVFFSYFPTDKITVYGMTQHTTRFKYGLTAQDNDAITTPANWTVYGAGFKYQFNSKLNVELLYSNFWRSENAGLGETFNVGIKYIH